MNHNFNTGKLFKKALQSIWHQVNCAEEVFLVGHILGDAMVKRGTGWGAEFSKLCDQLLHVFNQEQNLWFKWSQDSWKTEKHPKIKNKNFAGTGTRFLSANGKKVIKELFETSFKK